ncbi:restriction endonuclease subunit S [Psychrobacter lutiphocae]|uniref:restriction endonuclease subunit S n=1 Tax=Psychrobacter lutiphocae TaxID=540500 RepID=UPI000377A49E|nr:restriction endonuclease subunit S [Psychrobacter lutiphocae]
MAESQVNEVALKYVTDDKADEQTNRYKAYPEYKDSGVEWLGDIPSGWDAQKLKFLCTYNDEVLPESTSKDKELIYVDIGSVSATEGITNTETITYENSPSRARRIVRDGDVILSTVRTYLEAIAPINNPPENMVVSTGFAVIRPTELLYKGFASYSLRFKGFIGEVVSRSVGVSYPAINSSDLVNIKIVTPSVDEQIKIANFLDHETAKIDTLIEKQQRLIELLTEKRQAVISHAVTKGLNPDVPMKDSGVEWLGEVPAHWEVSKLSFKLKLLSGDGITSNDIEATGEYPVLGGNGLRGYTNRYNCDGDYVLIGRQGALCGNINLGHGKFFATEHAVVVYPHEKFDIVFLSEFLRFMDLGQYSVSAAQPGISVDRINSLKIAVPPYQEQVEIGKHLKNLIETFEKLSNKAKQQIQLLSERRTALISAAVTGKIDVRDWVKPE